MRFLQKSDAHAEGDQNIWDTKCRKKRRALSEEELSRYFDTGRGQPKEDHRSQGPPGSPQPPNTLRDPSSILPAMEPPLKSIPGASIEGFQPPGSSGYTWSESTRTPSMPTHFFRSNIESLTIGQLQNGWRQNEQTKIPPVGRSCGQSSFIAQSKDIQRNEEPDQFVSDPKRPKPSGHLDLLEATCSRAELEGIPHRNSDKSYVPVNAAQNPEGQRTTSDMKTMKTNPVEDDGAQYLISDVEMNERAPIIQHDSSAIPAHQRLSPSLDRLLLDCKSAARASPPAHQESNIIPQLWIASHNTSDLHLWRSGEQEESRHNDQDDAALLNIKHGQVSAIEYWDEDSNGHESEEVGDCVSDSPYTWLEHGVLLVQGEESCEDDYALPEDYEASYHTPEFGGLGEFADFWQPNRLY